MSKIMLSYKYNRSFKVQLAYIITAIEISSISIKYICRQKYMVTIEIAYKVTDFYKKLILKNTSIFCKIFKKIFKFNSDLKVNTYLSSKCSLKLYNLVKYNVWRF